MQRHSPGIGDTRQAEPPGSAGAALDTDDDQGFLASRPSATESWFLTTDERLVDFDVAVEQLSTGDHHRSAQLVQPRPGRLVAAQPEQSLQPKRGGSVLRGAHVPGRGEPLRQW